EWWYCQDAPRPGMVPFLRLKLALETRLMEANMSTGLITPQQPSVSSGPPTQAGRRLLSLDALRGFDMFWIVGAEEVVHALAAASPNGLTEFLKDQFTH